MDRIARSRMKFDNCCTIETGQDSPCLQWPCGYQGPWIVTQHRLPETESPVVPIITRLTKSTFSRSLATGELISDSRAAKGERGIWQRRYREFTIRDEDNFARHIDYAHVDGNFGERS
jgi:hypothetical protein